MLASLAVLPEIDSRLKHLTKLRSKILASKALQRTPVYLYDSGQAASNAARFFAAFKKQRHSISPFYAIKSNPHLYLLQTLVAEGFGLDASSEKEIEAALAAKARALVYTGPSKTADELGLLRASSAQSIVYLESVRELELFNKCIASKPGSTHVRCGIRVSGQAQAQWNKFGVPLSELAQFLAKLKQFPKVKLSALQFHSSQNKDPAGYSKTLKELASVAQNCLSEEQRSHIEIVDVGGGFLPPAFEAYYAWNKAQRCRFEPVSTLMDWASHRVPALKPISYPAIEEYAAGICKAWKAIGIETFPNAVLAAEPGRWISHSVLHFLWRVMECKGERSSIVDGGTNMVGWEKHQYYRYVPILNLSSRSWTKEFPNLVYGSLCTPDDVWGYSVIGKKPEQGDLLLMPFQGAYTYALAQNFIRRIPEVVKI